MNGTIQKSPDGTDCSTPRSRSLLRTGLHPAPAPHDIKPRLLPRAGGPRPRKLSAMSHQRASARYLSILAIERFSFFGSRFGCCFGHSTSKVNFIIVFGGRPKLVWTSSFGGPKRVWTYFGHRFEVRRSVLETRRGGLGSRRVAAAPTAPDAATPPAL